MNWLATVSALIRIISWLIQTMEQRKWINEGERQALARLLRGQADAIAQADDAREKARASNAAVPKSSSLSNDGFRRD